ncbi:glycosyltransferase family 2 protein [Acuticoccus sp. MNP-M23]|uniref:glycosyltransferase family 2 protein n=1 Tax=Acuticoccus sp. MNP-M23 TaxID=3072793 RepID=UPI002815BE58|nr:glycosyltransferase family 2 protein [Acuticoccus sp. MNP-M23]WMS43884.1 glycosyltransferase family 2 protein [Acuticoccus sp. MNP-M23]
MNPTPAISICIPAFRAEAFLEETLRAAVAQEGDFEREFVVSVDGPSEGAPPDRTEEIARDCLAGERLRLVVQPHRFGWVRNTNAALRLATEPRAMILPHDDILLPGYLHTLMTALDNNSAAVLAFCDMSFLNADRIVSEPGETGNRRARLEGILRHHFPAIAWRGVFRRKAAPRHLVPTWALADFGADTLWVARMAAQGAIVRVPRALYKKRIWAGSAHAQWRSASETELDEMWIVHCLETVAAIASISPAAPLAPSFRAALQSRLARENVRFVRPLTRPAILGPNGGLLAMLSVYARVRRRDPHYSWSARTGAIISASRRRAR